MLPACAAVGTSSEDGTGCGSRVDDSAENQHATPPLARDRQSFNGDDAAYWSYPHNRLAKAIGARTFAFEPDSVGTLMGGSHFMATARDFARFGQLYLQARIGLQSVGVTRAGGMRQGAFFGPLMGVLDI